MDNSEEIAKNEAERLVSEVEKKIEKEHNIKTREKVHEEAKINEHLERSRKYSLKDSAAVNINVGLGENYISAYAVALNASPTEIGLLTSIPNLIAPLAQLATSRSMQKNSRKQVYSRAILIQSLLWLPIIFISFLFLHDLKQAPMLLVIFYTVYALFGNFAAPAWVSWMGDLIDPKEAGKFLGLRNKIGGITALISMIIGGVALDLFKAQADLTSKVYISFIGFGIIFFLAMLFRLLSRHFVLKQHEPNFKFERDSYFSFLQFIKKIPKSNFGKFSLYVALIVLATNIAAPYFTLYMLKDLNYSYVQFMIISVASAVATFVFISKWGKFADKHGNIQMLKITSLLIPIICFLWPVGAYFVPEPFKFPFIIAINFFSGYAWAGFNMAAGNFVFEAATPQRRGLCSAYSSVMNGVAVFLGATIGSVLISKVNISFMSIILFVSLISGVARYLVFFIMRKSIKEIREVKKAHWKVIPMASDLYNLQQYITNGILLRFRHKKVEVSSDVPLMHEESGKRD
jgi:MFS family permease